MGEEETLLIYMLLKGLKGIQRHLNFPKGMAKSDTLLLQLHQLRHAELGGGSRLGEKGNERRGQGVHARTPSCFAESLSSNMLGASAGGVDHRGRKASA